MRHLSNRYFTRVWIQGQLALSGLRSAEPGLGQPWRPLATGRRRRDRPGRAASAAICELAHGLKRARRVLAPVGGGRDERRDLRVERLHPRVRVSPAIVELVLDQLAQKRPQRRALEQERAGRHQETDRELYRVDR